MDIGEVRARVETDLDDATLTTILEAETQFLHEHCGSQSDTTTFYASGLPVFALHRPASSIATITERRGPHSDPVVLSANDWRQSGGFRLYRLNDGDNPASTWGSEVVVEYDAEIDKDLRNRVILDLVLLSVEFRAFTSEDIGDYKRRESDDTYTRRRNDLVRQVSEGRATIL